MQPVYDIDDSPGEGSVRWSVLAGGLALVAVVLGAFLLGRSMGETDAAPTATPPTTIQASSTTESRGPVADLLGPGRVLAEVDFTGGGRALLFCRDREDAEDLIPSIMVAHVGVDAVGGEYLKAITEITNPRFAAAGPCRACGVDRIEMAGEEILFGQCLDGGTDGAGTAFAVAAPRQEWTSPLGLDIRCGGTRLTADGDMLVLTAWPPRAGTAHEVPQDAPIRFTREDGKFVADDLELLEWNCDLGDSGQLYGRSILPDEPALSYKLVDSEIGAIGIHGPVVVVVGVGIDQCRQLQDAWSGDDWMTRTEATAPIADATGLIPPDGVEDWYWTCDFRK